MRIMMLAQSYPPIMGGIERHVQSLGAALTARGHTVTVVTLQQSGQAAFEQDGSVNLYRVRGWMQHLPGLFTSGRQHSPPFPDPGVTQALRPLLARERPEVVHAHDWLVRSFLPLKAGSGAKLVRTVHSCELACAQMRMMYMDTELCAGPAVTKCVRCAAHHYGPVKGAVTYGGNQLANSWERAGVDRFLTVSRAITTANRLTDTRGVQVIPNFVPDDIADGPDLTDARLDQLPPDGFILQVGDLARDKGIAVLLEAYQGLVSPPPLVLIGRRVADTPANFPPNVTVIEGWPHALVMQAWRRCLFGTVPSICLDACPTVSLEAMAAGRPVVGSRIGGLMDQIVEGETGWLVPPGDAGALRQVMARLIADPAECDRLGAAARRQVTAFQARRVVDQIELVYQTLLQPAGALA